MNELRPYISINGGYKSTFELSNFDGRLSSTKKAANSAGYDLYIGVQASEKTQIEEAENKYGRNWYPVGDWLLSSAIDIDGNSTVHINYDCKHPEALPYIAKIIYNNAKDRVSHKNNISGLQHNRLPWHHTDYADSFAKLQRIAPVTRTILQASEIQLSTLSPVQLAESLKPYEGVVTDVLLDGSSGTGRQLDPTHIRRCLEAIYDKPGMPMVAVAGGLSPATAGQLLEGIIFDYPKISVDAETGLRDNYDKTNPKASIFSTKKAIDFVSKILELSARDLA